MELRVEKNTHKLLNLFDELGESFSKNSDSKVISNSTAHPPSRQAAQPINATFFILGWIAKRLPALVQEIKNRGHEIASHGFCHDLCSLQGTTDLRKDLIDSKNLLEDIIGSPVLGYRAPSFSVNHDILKIIEDVGFSYDASYNSFDKHGRYGKLAMKDFQKAGIAYKISDDFFEIPVSNLSFQSYIIPLSGGGYFRLLPLCLFKTGVQRILKRGDAYHFYIHPWEIDAGQPRVKNVSSMFKFRHYVNIDKTIVKLKNLITSFSHCRFQTLSEYLSNAGLMDGLAADPE
jgi:polysaccharide deacetylase family protein (PEP-CTERM system associated)